jgi:small subunit ribosomal protein S20
VPQKKAAFKAIKVSEKKRLRNQAVINEVKTLSKRFRAALDAGEGEKVKKILTLLIKRINQAKSKGIIHRATASRKISRIMKNARKLK